MIHKNTALDFLKFKFYTFFLIYLIIVKAYTNIISFNNLLSSLNLWIKKVSILVGVYAKIDNI
jgi:hypothetical protein